MICSSEKRFFTSNLLALGNWTPDRRATQSRGDVVKAHFRGQKTIDLELRLHLSSATAKV